jgi:HSP20 family protein
MNLPTRWSPFRQLSRMDPFVDFPDLFREFGARALPRDMERVLDMRLDLTEDDKTYFAKVDLPGVKKGDIDVSVEGNQVTISAEVKREATRDNEKEVYSERYSGKAFRTFTLPAEVDSAKCGATYDGGVLTLTLPKKNGGGARHVTVN